MNAETEHHPAVADNSMHKDGGTLVAWLARQLRERIVTGKIKPGEQLPAQANLMARYKVSRTVVREAVAALHADGLLEVRHGVGMFVLEPIVQAGGFRPVDRTRLSSVIDLMELRTAVEVEAAALAAERRSPAQEEALYARFDEFSRLAEAGENTAAVDFKIHLAVADATNNPRFREFLLMMGEHVIPRSAMAEDTVSVPADAYTRQIQTEHLAVIQAISARDGGAARAAMRRHLSGGEDRYRRLLYAL